MGDGDQKWGPKVIDVSKGESGLERGGKMLEDGEIYRVWSRRVETYRRVFCNFVLL